MAWSSVASAHLQGFVPQSMGYFIFIHLLCVVCCFQCPGGGMQVASGRKVVSAVLSLVCEELGVGDSSHFFEDQLE